MLIITNGDSAAGAMRDAGIGGEILPWRDALHEGPVPAGLELEQLSEVRAGFIAEQGGGTPDEVLGDFRGRDRALADFGGHDEVFLWFEHDLYDQLQLIQLLDWFNGRELGDTRLTLRSEDEFLTHITADDLASSRLEGRGDVTTAQLGLGTRAWRAFRSDDPSLVESLLYVDTKDLPHLRPAITRLLEEFPSVDAGLSRTERQALSAAAEGAARPDDIFTRSQAMEEAAFLGDLLMWSQLRPLTQGEPLLRRDDGGEFELPSTSERPDESFLRQRLHLTEAGRQVLAGEADRTALCPLDRWLGGVHLTGEPNWRWDGDAGRLVASAQGIR